MKVFVILFLIWNALQSADGVPSIQTSEFGEINNSSTAAVITYGAPLQATDVDGFDVLTSDGGTQTFASGFAMTTRLPETVSGLAINDDGSFLIVFGDFTVWNNTRVGNILKYVPSTHSWMTMGSGVSGIRIDDVIIVNNIVIMVGHFQAFASNPNTNVYNVGQCDQTGESCSSLGSGVLDYADDGILAAVNTDIYLSYESDEGRACVLSYFPLNVGAKQWTNLIRDPDTNCWIRLAAVGENLYAVGNFSLPGLTNIVNFASYDGTYWTVLLEDGLLPVTYKEYPSVSFVVYEDGLFLSKVAVDNFTTDIYYWNGKEFALHFSTVCNGTLGSYMSGGEVLLLGCNKTILDVNPWVPDYEEISQMTCNTDYNHFLTSGSYMYALCFPNEYVLQMQTYNSQNQQREANSNVTNIASVELHLRAMCALGEQLFIGGLFTLVDDVATPSGAAMWDGEQWVSVFFTNSSDIWIRCATDSESILLVGIVDWYNNYQLKMAQYIGQSKFAVYSSNITEVQDVSTIAFNTNYSFIAIHTQAGAIQIVRWNILSKEFSIYMQLDGNYNDTDIRTLAATDDHLYIGGNFHWDFGEISYLNIAKYNLNTSAWEYIGWIGTDADELAFVDSIVITSNFIYAAGSFSGAAGLNYVQNIAGASMNGTWTTNLNGGLPGVLESLQFDGEKLYFIQLRIECQSAVRLSTCTNLFSYDTTKHTTSLSLKVGVASIAVSFIEPSNIVPGESSSAPLDWELYGIIAGCVFGFIIVSLVVVYWYRKIKLIWKYQDIPDFVRAWGSGEEEIDFQNEDFELKNVLGRGSFGTVWSCVLPHRNGASFAVKQMLISLGDKERIEMVENEIQVLQKLRHKYIVHFVGYKKLVSKTSVEFFLFMELFEKPCSLKGVIQKKQSRQAKFGYAEWFSFDEVKKFITQMAEGLQYLHENRIAHRDLKTANILVRTQTTLKVRSVHIADFGLATDAAVDAMASTVTGTPCYMAPEVLNKEKYDPFKADIWSLGIVIYEILTWREPSVVGKRPEFPPDRTFNDERFSGILELFEACTELQPRDRPTATEILQMCNYLQF